MQYAKHSRRVARPKRCTRRYRLSTLLDRSAGFPLFSRGQSSRYLMEAEGRRLKMQTTKGFTLVEVMITIAVLVILLGLAVPGFQSLVQNTRATTLANEFAAGLMFARSEAVKRGAAVTLCPAGGMFDEDDDEEWIPGAWASGWFVVAGNSCTGMAPGSAQVLRTWPAPNPRSSIQATGGGPRVTFSPLGGLDGVAPVFDIRSSGCVGERARELRIGPGGSMNVRRVACD